MIKVSNLSASIGDKRILNNISFVVEPGDFTLMVGSSSEDIKSTGKITIK
jgi:ABC-type multidrug transport system ATPase subunit